MKIQVLDHGYVEFIEAWGTGKSGDIQRSNYDPNYTDYEVGIIEAARQSTSDGFVSWEPYKDHPKGDAGLLEFLYKNKHETPFEFAGMVIEVQAPIIVFREWHRHRTQSYNEMSARYTPLPDLYYEPTLARVSMDGGKNKQAQGINVAVADVNAADDFLGILRDTYTFSELAYQRALLDGIPKELARLVMPVGHYSRMRASANLRNWLAFMTLRCDERAQWEIRQYANTIATLIAKTFPRTYALFNKRTEL